jgi:diguanylate cyclase (GGDEF)-like protein
MSFGDRLPDSGLDGAHLSTRLNWFLGGPMAVLRTFLIAGGVLVLLCGWMPGGPQSTRHLLALGGTLIVLGAGLLMTRRLPVVGQHLVVATGTVVICLLVARSEGDVLAGLHAAFLVWVGIFVGLYMTHAASVLHLLFATGLAYAAFAVATDPASAVLFTVLGAAPALTVGHVVGHLVRAGRSAASLDPTTGVLASVAALRRVLNRTLARRAAVIVLIELDSLPELYETFGADCGDDLLREVAHRLRTSSPGPVALARWGGERFVVVLEDAALPGGHGAVACRQVAGQVLASLSAPFSVGDAWLRVHSRAGAALVPARTEPETALSRAAVALGYARREHERVWVWNPDSPGMNADDLILLEDLRTAGDRGELSLVYQPIVAATDGAPWGVEALLRWNHPERGSISPGVFVPLAERHGAMDELTRWVLDTALQQNAAWRRTGLKLGIAVNVSPAVLHDLSFPGAVAAALMRHGVPPSALTLEITETAVATRPDRARAALSQLREMGVRLSLDDFGTGYTSLVMLDELPLDEIKVDRAFIGRMLADPAKHSIAATIRALGSQLGVAVVAEGVEDGATFARIAELGFDFAQGFHLARPAMPADVPELLRLMGLAPSAPLEARA